MVPDLILNGYINPHHVNRGQLRLSSPADTLCINAGEFYKIAGTMQDGVSRSFEVVSNKLKYIGETPAYFLLTGVSDLYVDKACETVYALYMNGILVPEAQTPHTFVSPSKVGTISITALISLIYGDELDVYVKSSEINTTISVQNLNIVFWGE